MKKSICSFVLLLTTLFCLFINNASAALTIIAIKGGGLSCFYENSMNLLYFSSSYYNSQTLNGFRDVQGNPTDISFTVNDSKHLHKDPYTINNDEPVVIDSASGQEYIIPEHFANVGYGTRNHALESGGLEYSISGLNTLGQLYDINLGVVKGEWNSVSSLKVKISGVTIDLNKNLGWVPTYGVENSYYFDLGGLNQHSLSKISLNDVYVEDGSSFSINLIKDLGIDSTSELKAQAGLSYISLESIPEPSSVIFSMMAVGILALRRKRI